MGQFEDSDIICIAQGVIMGAHGVGPEDAALVLFTSADELGRPLAQVAAEIVEARGV